MTITDFVKKVVATAGYRIISRKGRWGVSLFDDIEKTHSCVKIRTVLDIGANRGQTAKVYLREFPSAMIYSFEPGQEAFRELRRMADTRKDSRLKATNAAVGAQTGVIKLRCLMIPRRIRQT